MRCRNYTYALFLVIVSALCFWLGNDALAADTKVTVAYADVKLPKQKVIKKKQRVKFFSFYRAFDEADTTPWEVTQNGSDIIRTTAGCRDRHSSTPTGFIQQYCNAGQMHTFTFRQVSGVQYFFVPVVHKLIFPKHWFW